MGSKMQEYRDSLERQLLDKRQPWTQYFDKAERQLGVNRVYIFVGLVVFIGLYLVFGIGCELVCNSIAFIYPAYMSMKALESPSKNDDTKWLTYWVVFAVFSLLEYFADLIVGWFPFYWLMKCIFVIWLMLPGDMNGSLILYNRVLRPNFQKYSGRIDHIAGSGMMFRPTTKQDYSIMTNLHDFRKVPPPNPQPEPILVNRGSNLDIKTPKKKTIELIFSLKDVKDQVKEYLPPDHCKVLMEHLAKSKIIVQKDGTTISLSYRVDEKVTPSTNRVDEIVIPSTIHVEENVTPSKSEKNSAIRLEKKPSRLARLLKHKTSKSKLEQKLSENQFDEPKTKSDLHVILSKETHPDEKITTIYQETLEQDGLKKLAKTVEKKVDKTMKKISDAIDSKLAKLE